LPPELDGHPDGHKAPEGLEAFHCELKQLRTIGRAAHVHEHHTALDSTGDDKRTRRMVRSISAEGLSQVGAYHVEPARAEVKLVLFGKDGTEL
jgi:hypothetical protein